MGTSKERAELFHGMVIEELLKQLNSRSDGKYLRAAAELVDYPTIRPVPGLGKELTKDIKKGKPRGRHARKPAPVAPPNMDAAVEHEVERRVELERERGLERAEARNHKAAAERVREPAVVGVDRRAAVGRDREAAGPWPSNARYANVRGLTRGR
jgi:hypothetical protein